MVFDDIGTDKGIFCAQDDRNLIILHTIERNSLSCSEFVELRISELFPIDQRRTQTFLGVKRIVIRETSSSAFVEFVCNDDNNVLITSQNPLGVTDSQVIKDYITFYYG